MFTRLFTPESADIDELGHVNNAVWVRWIQDLTTAHWHAAALTEHIEAFIWVVTRHEIDYRGNVVLGDSVTGKTWIEKPPKGAQFERRVDFVNATGKVLVSANTSWALIDKASGRLLRVPAELAGLFLPNPSS
jgi:acyl-CoA thioester hydrolase